MYTHVRVAVAAVALSGLMSSALVVAASAETGTAQVQTQPDKPKKDKPKKCDKKKHHGKKSQGKKSHGKKKCHDKKKGGKGGKGSKGDGADPSSIPMPTTPDPVVLTWKAEATSTVAKLDQDVTFPATSFTGTILPLERTLSGPLVLPPAKTSLKLGDLDLVKITMEAADASPVDATIQVDDTLWTVQATQTFSIKIRRLTGPADLVNLVKPGCGTAPTTASLSGTVDFAKFGQPGGPGDYTMSGSYAIPEFTGCGALMDSLLTDLVSGPGNALSVHFTG
jgi:hypothetical protein